MNAGRRRAPASPRRRIAVLGLGAGALAIVGLTTPAPGILASAFGDDSSSPAAGQGGRCDVRVLAGPRRGADAERELGPALASVAARAGLTGRSLAERLATDRTLWVDSCGDLLFQDEVPEGLAARARPPAAGAAVSDLPPDAVAAPLDGSSWPGPVSGAEAFTLHSRPGAERVLLLDFDGHLVDATAWNTLYQQGPWTAPAFSFDADPGFSDAERAVVVDVWRRVAQDYAPFGVDVTTEDPGSEAMTRSGAEDTRFGTRVLISPDDTQTQCACGGRAYIDVFDRSTNHAAYQPAWVYPQVLDNNAKYIADAASHEAGHTLGLSHDGTQTAAYSAGSGGWGPIMGAPYGQAVTQWSDGSYPTANNAQDDVAIIAGNGIPLVADDVPDTLEAALPVPLPAALSGMVNTRTDIDRFAVTSSGGTLRATVSPAWPGANLDASLVLSTGDGTVLATSAPAFDIRQVQASVGATLEAAVLAGRYVLTVDGTGSGVVGSYGETDYGSVGWYALEVSQGPGPSPSPSPSASPSASASASPSWSPTPWSPAPTPRPSAGSPTPTPTARPSGSPTATSSRTASPSPTQSATVTPGVTASPSGTPSESPTASPTATASGSPDPTASPTGSESASASASPSLSATSPAPPTPSATATSPSVAGLAVRSTYLPRAARGRTYRASLRASGGIPPYRWRASTTTIPTGLAVTTRGTVRGTPTVRGLKSMLVRVTDVRGVSKRGWVKLRVG